MPGPVSYATVIAITTSNTSVSVLENSQVADSFVAVTSTEVWFTKDVIGVIGFGLMTKSILLSISSGFHFGIATVKAISTPIAFEI